MAKVRNGFHVLNMERNVCIAPVKNFGKQTTENTDLRRWLLPLQIHAGYMETRRANSQFFLNSK